MADRLNLYTASSLVYTGKGHLTGILVSTTSATAVGCICYDATTDGGGAKLFEMMVTDQSPVVIWFKDQYAPRFSTGLFIHLGLGMYATVYCRVIL